MIDDFWYAFAAVIINTVAASVAIGSLHWAKSSTSISTTADQLIWRVLIVLGVSFLLLVLHRDTLRNFLGILGKDGFNSGLSKPQIIGGLALADYWVLYHLIGKTGGPTQSWFTPFLLAIVPIVIMLREDPYLCLIYLVVTIGLFLLLLKRSPDARGGFEAQPWGYEIWYGVTSALTVIFPLAIKIFDLLGRR